MNYDIAKELRRACGYENLTPTVRRFQSGATNGLVVDAADEIERLRAALKPFAEAADVCDDERDKDKDVLWESGAAMELTVVNLRRAKAAFNGRR